MRRTPRRRSVKAAKARPVRESPDRFGKEARAHRRPIGAIPLTADQARDLERHVAGMARSPRDLPARRKTFSCECATSAQLSLVPVRDGAAERVEESVAEREFWIRLARRHAHDRSEAWRARGPCRSTRRGAGRRDHAGHRSALSLGPGSGALSTGSHVGGGDPPDVAWGRVSESGIYVAIGLPGDPIARAALEVFRVMAPLEETIKARGDYSAFTTRICGSILCAPDIARLPIERFDEGVSVGRSSIPVQERPPGEARERPRPPRALAPAQAARPSAKSAWVCPHGTSPSRNHSGATALGWPAALTTPNSRAQVRALGQHRSGQRDRGHPSARCAPGPTRYALRRRLSRWSLADHRWWKDVVADDGSRIKSRGFRTRAVSRQAGCSLRGDVLVPGFLAVSERRRWLVVVRTWASHHSFTPGSDRRASDKPIHGLHRVVFRAAQDHQWRLELGGAAMHRRWPDSNEQRQRLRRQHRRCQVGS